MTMDRDDPKLTAYVLGELDEAERAAVEAELERSAELRRAADAIRRAGELVAQSLRAEPAPALDEERRQRIEAASRQAPVARRAKPRRRRRVLLAAAATLLVAVGLSLYALPRLFRPPSSGVNERHAKTLPSAQYAHDDASYLPAEEGPSSSRGSVSGSATEVPMPAEPPPYAAGSEDELRRAVAADVPPSNMKDIGILRAEDQPFEVTVPPAPEPGMPLPVLGPGQPGFRAGGPDPNGRRVLRQSAGGYAGHMASEEGMQQYGGYGEGEGEEEAEGYGDFDGEMMMGGAAPEGSMAGPGMAGGGEYAGDRKRFSDMGYGFGSLGDYEESGGYEGDVSAYGGYGVPGGLGVENSAEEAPPESGATMHERYGGYGGQGGFGGLPGGIDRLERVERSHVPVPDAGGQPGLPGQVQGHGPARDGQPVEPDAPEPPPAAEKPRGAAGTDGRGQAAEEEQQQRGEKAQGPATWRRARATPNASRLMIGDRTDLPLEGMQAHVEIDGFRARVILDYYFYNHHDRRYEGTFKLRLPDEASLYFFAFGPCKFEYKPDDEGEPARPAFLMAAHRTGTGSQPEEILKLRADTWSAPKVARVVPREKAAFAYRQTVRRRVDPALVEWSGAGIFSARVFPLTAKKLHRIVVGYDVDLTRVGDQLEYRLDLPDVDDVAVDVSLATWPGGSATVTPRVKPFTSNGRASFHVDNPADRRVVVQLEDPGTVLLRGSDEETGDYFAVSFGLGPEVTGRAEGAGAGRGAAGSGPGSSTALFLLDTSLSSNPDKFNVWLKLLREILDANRDTIRRFAVLTFDIQTHWWQERFVENTPENVQKLLDDAHQLSLEGATDLGQALRQAARPSWLPAGEAPAERWDVFLLSDGGLTWGETDLRQLASILTSETSAAGALFAYRTGMAGTAGDVLETLAQETGGAVFSVVGEGEIAQAARAHRSRPWQVAGVAVEGGRDLLLAGRPRTIFPGQRLLLVGRGRPEGDRPVVLKLRRGKEGRTVRVPVDRVIDSPLAPRIFGQVAVGALELVGQAGGDMAVSYARHFRVPGRSCSLLMLESEADYQRFAIREEDDPFVVKSTLVAEVIEAAQAAAAEALRDPKALFQNWLERLEKMPGMTFRVSPALKLAIQSLPREAFRVEPEPLKVKHPAWDGMPSGLEEELSEGHVDYDAVQSEAQRRLAQHGPADALRIFSSLVESSPGNLALARDLAFSALAWELPEQAYHLLRRVAMRRPYEPQSYLAMAQALAASGHNDLALLYYEVALAGTWDGRFHDFHRIVRLDYLEFLRQVADARRKVHLTQYAAARRERMLKDVNRQKADLVVVMMWNTDGTDVDLHVVEPTGEECYYEHRQTRIGGRLTPDCTEGFGPEMYTLARAPDGKYRIAVHYYSSDTNRAGTRTKVYVTVYQGWGTGKPKVTRKAVTLDEKRARQEVATIGFSN